MKLSKDLIAASVTPLLLGILKEQDNYGYEIIKRVRELSNHELVWSEGMLYPVLHRLEKQQWIDSYWKVGESGRRRKYYKLKEAGLDELNNQKRQWELVHSIISETCNE